MRRFNINVNGVSYTAEVTEEGISVGAGAAIVPVRAAAALAPTPAAAPVQTAAPAASPVSVPGPVDVKSGETPVTAPMPGKVSKVNVKAGQIVKKGEVLMLLEAMKMQNEIGSPVAGTVKSVTVSTGENVKPGQVMIVIG